jgi:hypothetical protein
VNVLENITRDQAELLRQWGIRFRSISRDFGRQGIQDDAILPFLLRLKQPTFLTRDGDFFELRLCHARYCLAWLDVAPGETAFFIRRFLLHPSFRTSAQRMGTVPRIQPQKIVYWTKSSRELIETPWV